MENTFDYGWHAGLSEAKNLLTETLKSLPAGTTMEVKNVLLDLYNDLERKRVQGE